MSYKISPETLEGVIAFHGHVCPGLTIGIRAAEYAINRFGEVEVAKRVCVTETDMCAVDAIQFLTGCTFGKGNLIHRDYGKAAFSFFRRDTGEGFRLLFNWKIRNGHDDEMAELMGMKERTTAEEQRLEELRDAWQKQLMELPLEKLFECQELSSAPPRPACILQGLVCETCGEQVMESRTRRFAGKTLCIPCYGAVEQKV
ncbi:FmdE family protein [Pontiella sulfatireligans]|uniref:Formylmethanofuran dehydrogenase subunit E domain-containing protein n=1 Tax=Pontiella sulfatireligans TaxID=2750658 RepID=A0A6C2UJ05_9BACT|nr:FmdE family protein [Pontiella sulfatireligans]VGO19939.1 hypothetical protein SCARR_01999 [Pontiella sulfatireligans]